MQISIVVCENRGHHNHFDTLEQRLWSHVDRQTISKIIKGKSWKHLLSPDRLGDEPIDSAIYLTLEPVDVGVADVLITITHQVGSHLPGE